jgi:hypothetical protein
MTLRDRWATVRARIRHELHAMVAERDQFGYVLVLIVATLVLRAWAGDTRLGLFFSVALGGITLAFILHTCGVHRPLLLAVEAFVVFAIVITGISLILGSDTDGHQLAGLFGLSIAFAAPAAIIRRVGQAPVITFRVVLGALAIYLLFGLAFSYLFGFVAFLQGTPFFNQTDAPNSAIYLYFSYITMATVGYGDFTPATDLGRMLAVTEALLGQLYLVSVVAIIIGNIGRVRRPRGEGAAADGEDPVASVEDPAASIESAAAPPVPGDGASGGPTGAGPG